MIPYIQKEELIDLSDSELEAKFAEVAAEMDKIQRRPAPPEFWTLAANSNTIYQQLEARKRRRNI